MTILKRRTSLPGLFATGVLALGLAACQTTTSQQDSIGYRQAKFAEMEAVREFRACQDEVLTLDRQAQSAADPAVYLSSAKLAQSCELQLGTHAGSIPQDERMRGYALSIQNFLKAGDIRSARASLDTFKGAFVGSDLYLPSGASFIDTMDLLLGNIDVPEQPNLALLNANGELKDELRRTVRWGGGL